MMHRSSSNLSSFSRDGGDDDFNSELRPLKRGFERLRTNSSNKGGGIDIVDTKTSHEAAPVAHHTNKYFRRASDEPDDDRKIPAAPAAGPKRVSHANAKKKQATNLDVRSGEEEEAQPSHRRSTNGI
mmetsp:Transcript_16049/g.33579  ORF Transcript_16049/g.33579 Transcript_16049/m.33579 type:complete len:127 (+) Transcript_16049:58-438(+)